eukprot:scaffold1060_cov385-Pavlova_lutheri.AAC.36
MAPVTPSGTARRMVSATRFWMLLWCLAHLHHASATTTSSEAPPERWIASVGENTEGVPPPIPATKRAPAPWLQWRVVRAMGVDDVIKPRQAVLNESPIAILREACWCILPSGVAWLMDSNIFPILLEAGSTTKLAPSPRSASPTSLEEAAFHTLQLILVVRAAGLTRMEEWVRHPGTIWMEGESSQWPPQLHGIVKSMRATPKNDAQSFSSSTSEMALLRVLGAYLSALLWYLSSWRRLMVQTKSATTGSDFPPTVSLALAHEANHTLYQQNHGTNSRDDLEDSHPMGKGHRLGMQDTFGEETVSRTSLSFRPTFTMPHWHNQRKVRKRKGMQRKKDHWCMATHHLLASGLLFLSLHAQQMQAGLAVMAVHDAADPLLHLAKWMRRRGKGVLADTFFTAFALFFVAGRLVWLPWMTWCASSVAHNRVEILLVGMLVALVPLHVFWTTMIARVAWRRWQGNDLEDERSDEEDGEAEEAAPSRKIPGGDSLLQRTAAGPQHLDKHSLHHMKVN